MSKGNSGNPNKQRKSNHLLLLETSAQVQEALEAAGFTITSIDNFIFRCTNGKYTISYGELSNVVVKKACTTVLEFNPLQMEPINIVMMFHTMGIINLFSIPEFKQMYSNDKAHSTIPAMDTVNFGFPFTGRFSGNSMVKHLQKQTA